MPDATAAAQAAAAASDSKPAVPVNPDRVGEELADDANIWHVYDRVAREDDERRTKAWDNGLNNLALFAGLFSAITTAFIIEAQHGLEPDYAQLTFQVLNATNLGERFVHQPFIVPSSARTVNCLWVTSLVLSLSAALIAIMGKDWIGMYTARPVCNLRQWAEMRAYRLQCVEQWYMSGVIAAAPVLLHVSLLLFGAGLILFVSSDLFAHRLTLGLSLAAGVLYLVTTFSAVIFSTSPFKSPATQMIRSALSALVSYTRGIIYRPKRNLVHTLLCNINAMAVGGADVTAILSGCAPENWQSRFRRRTRALLSAAGNAAVARARKIPTSLRAACHNLQWSRVHTRLRSILSAAHNLPIDDWFFSSTWTDVPADRRPKLLADALSWLSGASQAPNVFRAIVLALGDLDIGRQVGEQTSLALSGRLRAHIRRTWRQADFLTLSRYVLADRNTPGYPVLDYNQFRSRFDLSKEPGLRCEDGLAAVIKLCHNQCHYISSNFVESYLPSKITQPRMPELLLPHIAKMEYGVTDTLVGVAHRYRAHLWRGGSLSVANLEAHLYHSLRPWYRHAYSSEVIGKYGGHPGVLELLTFLCCDGGIDDVTKPAAVELVMELLTHLHISEHPCLAYLFGSRELWDAAWRDKIWPQYPLACLSACLDEARRTVRPEPVRAADWQFHLALARTLVMLLSPHHEESYEQTDWVLCLFRCLCQSPSILDDHGKLDVIRLILDTAALLKILSMSARYYQEEITNYGTEILAAVISGLERPLRNPATIDDGEKLFAALVRTQLTGPAGDIRTWDLGEWLRVQAPDILADYPSSTAPMQDVHDALAALYPLCQANPELRAQWDRIGYPGRPGDIFSDPFLNVGAFFESAEQPRPPPETPEPYQSSDGVDWEEALAESGRG